MSHAFVSDVRAQAGQNFFATLFPARGIRWRTLLLVGVLGAPLLLPAPAWAVPYATSLTNDAGTIWFRLNEAADNVKIISSGGTVTNDLGALPAGLHNFALGIPSAFQVSVFKDAGPGYLQGVYNQIGSDTNVLLTFVNQRGVAVNKNPSSPAFGRIYVSVSQAGSNTVSHRVVGDGIYVLNADQSDGLGQGDVPLTGGLGSSFLGITPPNPEGPHRLFVAADSMVYIGDLGDTNGSLYVVGPDVTDGQNVFAGPPGSPFPITTASGRIHGSISAAYVTGSLATGDLVAYVIDEDLQTNPDSATQSERNSIWRWDIGAGPLPTAVSPVKISSAGIGFAAQLTDLAVGPDGKFYKSQRRAEPANPATSTPNILVLSSDGTTVLWDSLAATRAYLNASGITDLLNETCAIDVSPDGGVLAVLRRDTNSISILPLADGIPDLTNRVVIPTAPSTGVARDMGFDAAGNLYYVSSGQGLLRILSPGGATTAVTGSDGTFALVRPANRVSVVADDPISLEGDNTASFTITRSGPTDADLTVNYTLTGTASNGVDYVAVPLSVLIPAGADSISVLITPLDDDVTEGPESVILTLSNSSSYDLRAPSSATATIADNELSIISISTVDSNAYERLPATGLTFAFKRLGETNLDLFILYDAMRGTAGLGDFLGTNGTGLPPTVYFPPGQTTAFLTVEPVDDQEYEGDETVGIQILPNFDYFISTNDTAYGTILDDETPPGAVLFQDDLDAESSDANWTVRFGANNGVFDARTLFGFDYGAIGIPPAPTAQGTTRGLLVTVNKNDALFSSAGINLYPNGQSFSGNYALRFEMFVDVGNSNQTEHVLAGINHSGLLTNRVSQSPANPPSASGVDGLWFAIEAAAGNLRDYAAYTATNANSVAALLATRAATTLSNVITRPPYSFAGSPGNASNSTTKAWADVEIAQQGDQVTLKVNRSLVFQLTNATGFTSGNIMIGYNDQFDSRGSDNNYVIFDNVRVVSLDLRITHLGLLDNDRIQVDFASPQPGMASDFHLQRTEDLSAPAWNDVAGAVISAVPGGFEAIATRPAPGGFYRIRR